MAIAWRRALYLIPATVSAGTVVLAVLCMVRGTQEVGRPFAGFFYHANATVASMQRGGWEGPAAGLRPSDVITAIDGAPMRDGAAIDRWLAHRTVGERATFQVRRPKNGVVFEVELQLRRLTTADVLATFVLPYTIGVAYLLFGAIIFFFKRSYEAALAMSICVVAAVFYLTTFDAHTGHHFARLWVSYPLLGAVSVHLFSVFPAVRRRVHRFAVLVIPYGLAAGWLTYTQMVIKQSRFAALSFSSSYLALCFIGNMLLLTATARREPSADVQNKAKTIRAGLLAAAAAGVVWNLVARIYPELITAERVMMLSALFPVVLFYTVIKKNLFDVDIVLRTTTGYVIATAMVIALYFAGVYVIGLAMSGWTLRYVSYLQNVEAVVVSTMVVAMIFHPLRVRVQRLVDRFFFRAKGEPQEALDRLGKDLASMTLDLPGLAGRLTAEVLSLMRCRYVVLLGRSASSAGLRVLAVAGTTPAGLDASKAAPGRAITEHLATRMEPFVPGRTLSHAGASRRDARTGRPPAGEAALETLRAWEVRLVVPLRSGTTLSGALLLGPRHFGDLFTSFEMNALGALALPGALALENALLLREHAARERLAALGKLAAVIIHEIKNPLGIIRVSSGALKKRFTPADSGHELASFIEEEVVRMNQTIGQFLSFARPALPKLGRFNLAELVRRTAAAAEPELQQAGITLETQLDPEVPVVADADQVQQVLLNLMVNARQVLEGREGARLSLRLTGASPATTHPALVELVVADNGPGIDPSLTGRVFEPFFTTRPGGTGLGLAIARQLLEEQGGRISFRTGSGGTEFTVLLPSA